jgi:3-hydroxy-9,10-secoandrosta-1,3,5(10)-triene-9,17-dione monooxygenase
MIIATLSRSAKADLTAADFLDRAKSIGPRLRDRAEHCDSIRRLPEETLKDFVDLGLMKISQPARCGGYEMNWDTLCDVARILASYCGSQAWFQKNLADHSVLLGTFPTSAQDDVWSENPDTLVAASFDPVGRAKRVAGGFEFSGDHGFLSGIDHCDWVIAGGRMVDSPETPHFFLLPKSDGQVIDDWHTIGLCGTGSKSFKIEAAFVPEHRFLDGVLAFSGKGPGSMANKALVYQAARGTGPTAAGFAALCVGMAQGVLNEWVEYTVPRKSRGVEIAAQQGTQIMFARAAAEIEAAHLMYRSSLDSSLEHIASNRKSSRMETVSGRRNMAFAGQLCLSAATQLFNAAGGRALFLNSHMQRQYRNLIAAASHHGLAWDKAAVEFGQAVLQSKA